MTPALPIRGEVWVVDLDPTRRHQQAGTRPCLIVSTDAFNHCPAELVWVLPVTTKDTRIPFHVSVGRQGTGLREPSFAKVEELRSVPRHRLVSHLGSVCAPTMAAVEERLRILLEL